jgi:hypothetical protein
MSAMNLFVCLTCFHPSLIPHKVNGFSSIDNHFPGIHQDKKPQKYCFSKKKAHFYYGLQTGNPKTQHDGLFNPP